MTAGISNKGRIVLGVVLGSVLLAILLAAIVGTVVGVVKKKHKVGKHGSDRSSLDRSRRTRKKCKGISINISMVTKKPGSVERQPEPAARKEVDPEIAELLRQRDESRDENQRRIDTNIKDQRKHAEEAAKKALIAEENYAAILEKAEAEIAEPSRQRDESLDENRRGLNELKKASEAEIAELLRQQYESREENQRRLSELKKASEARHAELLRQQDESLDENRRKIATSISDGQKHAEEIAERKRIIEENYADTLKENETQIAEIKRKGEREHQECLQAMTQIGINTKQKLLGQKLAFAKQVKEDEAREKKEDKEKEEEIKKKLDERHENRMAEIKRRKERDQEIMEEGISSPAVVSDNPKLLTEEEHLANLTKLKRAIKKVPKDTFKLHREERDGKRLTLKMRINPEVSGKYFVFARMRLADNGKPALLIPVLKKNKEIDDEYVAKEVRKQGKKLIVKHPRSDYKDIDERLNEYEKKVVDQCMLDKINNETYLPISEENILNCMRQNRIYLGDIDGCKVEEYCPGRYHLDDKVLGETVAQEFGIDIDNIVKAMKEKGISVNNETSSQTTESKYLFYVTNNIAILDDCSRAKYYQYELLFNDIAEDKEEAEEYKKLTSEERSSNAIICFSEAQILALIREGRMNLHDEAMEKLGFKRENKAVIPEYKNSTESTSSTEPGKEVKKSESDEVPANKSAAKPDEGVKQTRSEASGKNSIKEKNSVRGRAKPDEEVKKSKSDESKSKSKSKSDKVPAEKTKGRSTLLSGSKHTRPLSYPSQINDACESISKYAKYENAVYRDVVFDSEFNTTDDISASIFRFESVYLFKSLKDSDGLGTYKPIPKTALQKDCNEAERFDAKDIKYLLSSGRIDLSDCPEAADLMAQFPKGSYSKSHEVD